MIHILSGPVHSGKTTLLKNTLSSLSKKKLAIDGYISDALWENNENLGYNLFDLKSRKHHSFIRKKGEAHWEKIGPFYFLPETMDLAKRIIHRSQKADLSVVDEVGPLELEGKGIWPVLKEVLILRDPHFLLIVRDSILDRFLEKICRNDVVVYDIEQKITPQRLAKDLLQNCTERRSPEKK